MRSSSFWNIMGNVSRLFPFFIFLVALSLLQAQFLSAQGTWELISPKLGSGSRESVRATPSGLVLVAGQAGSILRSSDGGTSWQRMQTNTGAWLFGVAISAENRCLAVGQAGTILLSTDAGLTWQQRQSGTQAGLLTVQWLNATTAIAAGQSGTVLKSTDGGVTWSTRPSFTTEQFESIHFMTDSIGVAVTQNRIWRTTDASNTWQERYAESSWGAGLGFVAVHFHDGFRGVAVKFDAGKLLRTNDGGLTWNVAYNSGGQFRPSSVYCLDSTTVLVGGLAADGRSGGILRSTNGGQSLEAVLATTRRMLDIAFSSPLTGVACDQEGGLWMTSDGGSSWRIATGELLGNLLDMSFWSESSGAIVSSSSSVYFTSDTGTMWRAKNTPLVLDNIFFPDSLSGIGTAYALSNEYRIPYTTDGGTSWTIQGSYPGVSTWYAGIKFWNRQQGCVVGSWHLGAGHAGPVLRYTSNAGLSWVEAIYPAPGNSYFAYMNALAMLENGIAFVHYYDGVQSYILKTVDFGLSWTRANVGTLSSTWSGMVFPTSATGFLVGPGGKIARTDDGGATWIQQNSTVSQNLTSVDFVTQQIGLIVGEGGTILYTSNGGNSWTKESLLTSRNLMRVRMFSSGRAIAIGDTGTLLRGRYPAPGTHVQSASNLPPSQSFLDQNYPNPFNGMTIIRLGLDDESPAVLSFYNTLGKKIDELASVSLPAGTYEFLWQPLNLASGVYFYVLRTSTLAFTKRLVYIK